MSNRRLAESLLEEGREYRAKAVLEKADDSYTRAISHDPTLSELYYELGNVNFLSGEYIKSINSYLAFSHLKLVEREKQLLGEIEFPDELKAITDNYYNSLPDITKKELPSKSAAYILEDGDICNHISHSYFGSQDISDDILLKNFKLYYATLVGPHLVKITLDQHKLSMKKYEDINLEVFIPQGRLILLDNILWDEVKSKNEDVLKLYFE